MIHDWITKTHGAHACRIGTHKRTVLFFVLTKFDTLFDEARRERVTIRPGSRPGSMPRSPVFSARRMSGPRSGRRRSSFKNCFWLRNPGFKAEAIIDYGGKRELGVRDGKKEKRIEALKAACVLATPEVQAHFAEPRARLGCGHDR